MEVIFVKFTESASWKKTSIHIPKYKNTTKFRIEFLKFLFSRAICSGDCSGQSSSWSSSGGGQVCCCFYSEQMAQERSVFKFEQNLLLFFAKKLFSSPTPTNINMEKFCRNINALLDFSFYFKHSYQHEAK